MRRWKEKKDAAGETMNNKYVFWALIAIELFMSFSFLGYIHIEPISLTFVYIPVLMAGCMLGPKEAAAVGAVSGLASIWKASAFYVGAGDAVFSPTMSKSPLESILLSVGPRTLCGLISGGMFYWAKRRKHPLPWIFAAAAAGRLIHTTLVYGAMELFFPETGFGLYSVLNDILRVDFIPFTFVAVAAVAAGYFFCQSKFVQELFARVSEVDRVNSLVVQHKGGRAAALTLVILSSFSVAIYFTNRIETVMNQYQIKLSLEISYDLLHLQIQFLMGIASLAFLVILAIVLYQKNIDYLYHEAKLDGLTGLLGRQQFFHIGEELLRRNGEKTPVPGKSGCFIILDVDRFKQINDTYGHPAGDQILKEVAKKLQEAFGNGNIFGRLGGDEFVALILEPLSKEEIGRALTKMKEELKNLEIQNTAVTCSIGVIPIEKNYPLERMYKDADRLLYEAKKNGKDQFVFGYRYQDSETDQEGMIGVD